jgi:hypothetical protein
MFSLMYEYQVSWPPHPCLPAGRLPVRRQSPALDGGAPPAGGEGFVVSSAERIGRGSTSFSLVCEIANSSRGKRGDGPRAV